MKHKNAKFPDHIAIEIKKAIEAGLKTKEICKRFAEYNCKPHDIYNMKKTYQRLNEYSGIYNKPCGR